jgi:hypothetical protein
MMRFKEYLAREIQINERGSKWLFLIIRLTLYAGLSALLLYISWLAWPDLIFDFGKELYSSWRITEGDVFNRDLTYFYVGPFSYYFNALWFLIFGTGINTIIAINFVLLLLLIYLLEDWLRTLSNKFTAAMGVILFLSIFAFGRYVDTGNYNYLTPYMHSVTHGIVLLFSVLLCLKLWTEKGRMQWLWIAGILTGITLLTKIEISVPAVVASGIFIFSSLYINKWKNSRKITLTFLVAFTIPLLITVLLFLNLMPFDEAIYAIFSPWLYIFSGEIGTISDLPFYKYGLGTDNVFSNFFNALKWSWFYLSFMMLGVFFAPLLKSDARYKRLLFSLIVTVSFLISFFLIPINVWWHAARPLPFLMAVGFVFCVWKLLKKTDQTDFLLPYKLASFTIAGALLLKMYLNTRLYHYGFTLAMPATLITFVILVYWFPKYLNKKYGSGWPLRALTIGLFMGISLNYMDSSSRVYSSNNFICCSVNKEEKIRTNELWGSIIDSTLVELDSRLKPGQTFSVLPRGNMLNYLLRRSDPTKRLSIMFDLQVAHQDPDIEQRKAKEGEIINSFIQNPPDFIVFVHMDTIEHGFRSFGKDFAVDLNEWIMENYKQVWQEGDPPFEEGSRFGTVIFERNKKS